MPASRWRSVVGKLGWLGAILLVVGLLSSRLTPKTPPERVTVVASALSHPGAIPAIYALSPRSEQTLRNSVAVRRALTFLASLQPTGTYILSQPDGKTVIPMDLAHAAIALAAVERVDRAEAALTWLYHQMIRRDGSSFDPRLQTDYAGSWPDELNLNGGPEAGTSRGRGEAVGIALVATYAVASQNPDYLDATIDGARIADLVRLAVDYLTQPSMLGPDGAFSHSPDYRVPFNEECARMTVGLRLASVLLERAGDPNGAEIAATGAARGLAALRRRTGLNQGMAYDYYAMGIWGLATPDEARQELSWLRSTGLVDENGVKNWDWQVDRAESLVAWARWWIQAQTISPSQTFDYAIASVATGDLTTALEVERRWLPLQRADGGFNDAYIFGLRLGFSRPTSYAVARFILLERLLTDVVGTGGIQTF